MTDYLLIVVGLIIFMLFWIGLFALVANELSKLASNVSAGRKDRKILKTAERCRRDFE